MLSLDKDLESIQQARDLIQKAKKAEEILSTYTQEQLDRIAAEIAKDCAANAERLAKMASEETGFGKWQDKTIKNLLGSAMTWDYCKNIKTAGILREDKEKKILEVGVPMGIVVALVPSTNPTSTVMYKSIISVKSGNTIIFSPHPGAKNCILETIRIIKAAAERAGAPDGTINTLDILTPQATDTLLKSPDIGVILATGGSAMVHAAYSSGNPAIGVGPGNGPAFIDKSADIPLAVKRIIDSKTFDNGTICASEQSIVTERCIEDRVVEELKKRKAYFLPQDDAKKLSGFMLRANGTMNPKIVGRSAQAIAQFAGITVPSDATVLVARQTEVSQKNPYAREKLCPILAFYVEETWEDCCSRCIELLHNEGAGHTMTIHSQNMEMIREFALKKPVSRVLVNVPASLGGVGAATGLAPALTLGCGAVGGSATSDNITCLNLINIRRCAWGLRELEDIRAMSPQPGSTGTQGCCSSAGENPAAAFTKDDIDAITKAVIARLGI